MANKKKTPKYFAIRIFLVPLLLYFLLVLPMNGIMFLKNTPDYFTKYKKFNSTDSLSKNTVIDTLNFTKFIDDIDNDSTDGAKVDTVVCKALEKHGLSLSMGENQQDIGFSFNGGGNGEPETNSISKWIIFIGIIVGIVFNFPLRRYFRKKRKNKPISEKIIKYSRKYLQYTPVVNSAIFMIGFIIIHIHSVYLLNSSHFTDELERNLYKNWFYISVISSILTVLFVYLWQKYRLEFQYIEHVYEADTLRKNIYKTKKSHSLKIRLWLVSIMTTVLPLVVVLFYAYMSVSTVKDLGLKNLTLDQIQILLGKFYTIAENINELKDIQSFMDLPFVSSVDVILAMVGMHTSVVVAIIYIFFVVNWTNKSITIPVKELMVNMNKTGAGELNNFISVRTNDEMGALTEGYNEMTQKISNFIEEISAMNRDLEQKVKDRTQEVVQQKEEIETQCDLILEKNEELIQQTEEIITQKDEIERQKKLVEGQNKNITDSIRYALRIQQTILPPENFIVQLFPQNFIFYKPKDIVSGDFYWFMQRDEQIFFAAVDCTGHGVPGALMSIVAHNMLNQAMRGNHIKTPSDILDYLSREIVRSFWGKSENISVRDGMDLVICRLDKKSMILHFAGIHNPLFIVRDKKLMVYKSDFIPLGEYYESEISKYTNHEIPVQKDDMIYIFSDGIIDQFGGSNKRRYMTKNLKETLLEIHSLPMNDQKEMLTRIFNFWRGNFEQTDDILVIGVKID